MSIPVCILLNRLVGITFKGLPVLMYHKVTDSNSVDKLTVSVKQLDEQLNYLRKKKYTTISLGELLAFINGKGALPARPILLTFDDGYSNNYTCLYPLLQQYGMKANIFLVAGFIQCGDAAPPLQSTYLHVDEIANMNCELVQYGLHSYDHKSYNDLTLAQIAEDIQKCEHRLRQLGIPYQPCLAYTYGAYPRRDVGKRKLLFQTLKANGIQCAFRIGNRVNRLPVKQRFLLQRIDVTGNDSFYWFKLLLVAGKKILIK